jgi:hypothetical protein
MVSLGFDGIYVAVSDDAANDDNFSELGRFNTNPNMPNTPISRWRMPNNPLSAKFNSALMVAMDDGADRIAIVPSDDFVSPAWVQAAREHPGDYLYPHCCAIVDAETQAAYVITKLTFGTMKYGAGRVVSRKVIDKLGGKLWPDELNKGLDGASHQRITRAGFEIGVAKTEGIPITDVKTAENLWPYKTWRDSGTPIAADQALHMVSPAVRAQLDKLRK